ncbi:hypothetical protein BJP36_41015 [Moorena producens JHB]|uniref:Uncharacterized protein n=1 Tax=Moorena producens (strain JHB) TaxID=1454205 RepID=A0A9Q9UVE7_MOOP1|nr:hypothetical protein [Moorena producens]WAN68749.1 hypothetical protein BJP36_41015 [Moorena producens JHB]
MPFALPVALYHLPTLPTPPTLPAPCSRFPIPDSRFPIPVPLLGGVRGGFRFPFPSWEGLGVGSDSRFPIPLN